jgi:hypothetical protein
MVPVIRYSISDNELYGLPSHSRLYSIEQVFPKIREHVAVTIVHKRQIGCPTLAYWSSDMFRFVT